MGAKKISALPNAFAPLTGAERLAGVQAGATVGFTVADLRTFESPDGTLWILSVDDDGAAVFTPV